MDEDGQKSLIHFQTLTNPLSEKEKTKEAQQQRRQNTLPAYIHRCMHDTL